MVADQHHSVYRWCLLVRPRQLVDLQRGARYRSRRSNPGRRRAITAIDHSVYPDIEHGEDFEDDYDRADYVERTCTACDFGVPPDRDTVALFRGWRGVFDRFPIPDSPSYHALRAHFRWPAVPMEPSFYLAPWETLDAIEGRTDPCKDLI